MCIATRLLCSSASTHHPSALFGGEVLDVSGGSRGLDCRERCLIKEAQSLKSSCEDQRCSMSRAEVKEAVWRTDVRAGVETWKWCMTELSSS